MLKLFIACVVYLQFGLLGFATAQSMIHYPKSPLAHIAAGQLRNLSPEQLDRNWQLNDFFGHIKIIGDKNSSRYLQLVKNLEKIGLTEDQFELSPSVVGATLEKSLWSRVPSWRHQEDKTKQGMAAAIMAHYNLIKDTKKRYDHAVQNYARLQSQERVVSNLDLEAAKKEVDRYSSVLIMEDNVAFGFLRDGIPILKGVGRQFRETLEQLPEDWDMFYFICMDGYYGDAYAQEVPGSPLLLKAVYGLVTKCFAVKSSAYDLLIEQYESYLYPASEFVLQWELPPADHIVARLHHDRVNAYFPREALSYRFASPTLVGSSPGGIDLGKQHWQPWPHGCTGK